MKTTFMFVLTMILVMGCTSKDSLKKTLKENPDIIIEAIDANPSAFIEALNRAVKVAQKDQAAKKQEEEQKRLEGLYDKPLQPVVRSDENIRGNKNAPITLIEYSDFECPFCARGYNTVNALREKYGKNLRFIYKHLPLSFHPQAMISSKYYEAIRLQSEEKAYLFHDKIYENQRKLKNGESFLKSIAKGLGVNMSKLAKDINSKEIEERIKADMAEAAKFGIQGTPGFVLNGIPVKGAYPVEHFNGIIDELKKRGKLKL